MAAPAPRCVCLMSITLAYRWEAAQERDFRFGSTLAYRLRIPTSIATLLDEAVAQIATALRLILSHSDLSSAGIRIVSVTGPMARH